MAPPDTQRRSGGAARRTDRESAAFRLVMSDVNVNGDGVVGRGCAVNATAHYVSAGSGVGVTVQDSIQFDGVADGHAWDEGADDGLTGGEVGGCGIAIQIEVRAANGGGRSGDDRSAESGLGAH